VKLLIALTSLTHKEELMCSMRITIKTIILFLFSVISVSCFKKEDYFDLAEKGEVNTLSFTSFGAHYYQDYFLNMFGQPCFIAGAHEVKDTSLVAICSSIRSRYDIPEPHEFDKTKDVQINALVIMLPKDAQAETEIELDINSFFLFYTYWGDGYVSRMKVADIEQSTVLLSCNEEVQYYGRPIHLISGAFKAKGSVQQYGSGESTPFDIQNGLFVVHCGADYGYVSGYGPCFDIVIEKCLDYNYGFDYPECWWWGLCDISCSCNDIYSCKYQRCNEQLCNI